MSLRRLFRTVRRGAQSIVRNPAIQMMASVAFPALAPMIALARNFDAPRESPVFVEPQQAAEEFPPVQTNFQPQSFLPLLAGAGAIAARATPYAIQGAQMLYNKYVGPGDEEDDDYEDDDYDEEEDDE